jgi:hypothetical protein
MNEFIFIFNEFIHYNSFFSLHIVNMSDMTDCLYEEGSVSEDEMNNDNLNSMTGFVGFESSDDNTAKMMVYLNMSLLIYLLFPRIYS